MNKAKGEHSYFICQRSGQKTRQCDGVVEPGTGWMVHKDWSDGIYNLKDHPQNKPPHQRLEDKPQRFALSGQYEAVLYFLVCENGAYLETEYHQPILCDASIGT